MKLKETKKYKRIDEGLDENILQMFKELGIEKPSNEKLQRCKDNFIEMFVEVDKLKSLIIEHTSNELIEVFSKSPKLLNIIKNSPEILDFVNDKRTKKEII